MIFVTHPIKFQDKSIWPTVRVFPWQQRPPGIHVTHLNCLPKTPALRRGHNTTTGRWSHTSLILTIQAPFNLINIRFKIVHFWNKPDDNHKNIHWNNNHIKTIFYLSITYTQTLNNANRWMTKAERWYLCLYNVLRGAFLSVYVVLQRDKPRTPIAAVFNMGFLPTVQTIKVRDNEISTLELKPAKKWVERKQTLKKSQI